MLRLTTVVVVLVTAALPCGPEIGGQGAPGDGTAASLRELPPGGGDPEPYDACDVDLDEDGDPDDDALITHVTASLAAPRSGPAPALSDVAAFPRVDRDPLFRPPRAA